MDYPIMSHDGYNTSGSSTTDVPPIKRRIDHETVPNQDLQTDFANKFRRLRACARCHRLKMRCVFEDPKFESCTRCFKSGLLCSTTNDPTQAQAKSRPRKKAKLKQCSTLNELQLAIDKSNKLLNARKGGDIECVDLKSLTALQHQLSETQRLIFHAMKTQNNIENNSIKKDKSEASTVNSMKDGAIKLIPSLPWISPENNIMKELINLEIITVADVKHRIGIFFKDLYAYWPCVSFPKHYTYDWLLENEPLVLLSFITVTCLEDPDLHDTLLYYLEESLSIRTSITGNISSSFIEIYLVLSLWCSPPRKWGSYKHQMSLLMALNLTLCLDLGNEVYRNSSNILKDNSTERQMIRSYMAVYACCGSLGLSLPRFKVVSWTPVHERCSQLLLLGERNQADEFLYYYSKLVALGEEIFQYLCPNGFPNISVRKDNDTKVSPSTKDSTSNPNSCGGLRSVMIDYERRMQKLAMESNLFIATSKMRNLLSIIYYQLLMTMYDYVVCRVLIHRDVLTEVYLQTLNRLIKASEKVIDSFCLLCKQTPNFPTFFYYRPMHALVALIRARLLVKTQQLDFEIDVEQEYKKVLESLKSISPKSKVANKMGDILTRILKWMKVSNKFNKKGATNSMVDLLNELGREKAIEKIHMNINTPNNEGDNMNMSKDSRLHFNNFINYSITRDRTPKINNLDSIPMKSEAMVLEAANNNVHTNEEDYSKSKFIPSPIGFSNSEIMKQQSTGENSPYDQNQYSSQPEYFSNDRFCIKDPIISTLNLNNPMENLRNPYIPENVTSKLNTQNSIDFNFQNDKITLDNAEMHVPQQQQQQQQQDFLNDLFNQIDTDIMNSQDITVPNGLGVPVMFDFLGTGCQGFTGNDLPIPDDWYKTL